MNNTPNFDTEFQNIKNKKKTIIKIEKISDRI